MKADLHGTRPCRVPSPPGREGVTSSALGESFACARRTISGPKACHVTAWAGASVASGGPGNGPRNIPSPCKGTTARWFGPYRAVGNVGALHLGLRRCAPPPQAVTSRAFSPPRNRPPLHRRSHPEHPPASSPCRGGRIRGRRAGARHRAAVTVAVTPAWVAKSCVAQPAARKIAARPRPARISAGRPAYRSH